MRVCVGVVCCVDVVVDFVVALSVLVSFFLVHSFAPIFRLCRDPHHARCLPRLGVLALQTNKRERNKKGRERKGKERKGRG